MKGPKQTKASNQLFTDWQGKNVNEGPAAEKKDKSRGFDPREYGDEEEFIKTVEDDILENKYSQSEDEQEYNDALSNSGTTINSQDDILHDSQLPLNLQIPIQSPMKQKSSSTKRTTSKKSQRKDNYLQPAPYQDNISTRNSNRREKSTNRDKSPYLVEQSPQIDQREMKKLREKVYFFEFVKPLHMKQQDQKVKKESLYKKLVSRAQNYRKYKEENSVYSNMDGSMSPQSKYENERKIKNLRISDYFRGKQLNIRSQSTKQSGSNAFQQQDSIAASHSIFHSDNNKLKREFIDAQKALSIMQSIKVNNEQESKRDESFDKYEDLNGGEISQRKKDWNSFLDFMKTNPEKLLNLVPSPPQTIEYNTQAYNSIVQSQKYIERPHSSYNQLASLYSRSGTRQIKTGHGYRQNTICDTVSLAGLKQTLQESRPQTTQNFYQRPKMLDKKSQKSQQSTQYTLNMLENNSTNQYPGKYSTIMFSDTQEQSSQFQILSQKDAPKQDTSLNRSQKSIVDTKTKYFTSIKSYQTKNSPHKITSKQLLQNMKFPMAKPNKTNKSLHAVDISVQQLQKSSKTHFSVFERSNQKLRQQEQLLKSRMKKPTYSLINDLSDKLKVQEWKQNPNFNKFTRQVNHQFRGQPKLMDWKNSALKKKIDQGQLIFNEEEDPKCLKEDEIEYSINLLRYNAKQFNSIDLLKPLFNKSLNTLEKIMEELMLGHLFDRISVKVLDINPESTLKILIRCKMMLQCRSQIIYILQIIEARESKLRDLNYYVINGGIQDPQLKQERENTLRTMVRELTEITDLFLSTVRELLSLRKIFGKAFIYDQMDYLKVVVKEMRQIKDILTTFGIKIESMQNTQQMVFSNEENHTLNNGNNLSYDDNSFRQGSI